LAEIKVNLPEELERKFRKTAKNIYGQDQQSLDKAAREAFEKWLSEAEALPRQRTASINEALRINEKLQRNAPKGWDSAKVIRYWRDRRR